MWSHDITYSGQQSLNQLEQNRYFSLSLLCSPSPLITPSSPKKRMKRNLYDLTPTPEQVGVAVTILQDRVAQYHHLQSRLNFLRELRDDKTFPF